jgi:hypothetical protein
MYIWPLLEIFLWKIEECFIALASEVLVKIEKQGKSSISYSMTNASCIFLMYLIFSPLIFFSVHFDLSSLSCWENESYLKARVIEVEATF